jgi:hypothetical protein
MPRRRAPTPPLKQPTSRPTIIQALDDPRIFGSLGMSAGSSWDNWRTLLKAFYGLALTPSERRFFCEVTGRSAYKPPAGGWRRVMVLCGRRAAKSTISGVVVAYECCFPLVAIPEGEFLFGVLVAQDLRGVGDVLFQKARRPIITSPALKALVKSDLQDRLILTNGITIACYPCRQEALRGPGAVVAVPDEFAHYRAATDPDRATDVEVIRAVRPMLANTGGKLVMITSPYAETGVAYDWHRDYYGDKGGDEVLVVQASARQLNPLLTEEYIASEERLDPEAARSELFGQFRSGSSKFLDPKVLEACTRSGPVELPPRPDVTYVAFADVATSKGDKFTIAVGHFEGDLFIVDYLYGWHADGRPGDIISEASKQLKQYRIQEVTGDRYAAGFVPEHFAKHHITYRHAELNASEIYLEALHLFNQGIARVPDHAECLRELRNLIRKPRAGGKDVVDHPSSGHDDFANAACGALWLAAEAKRRGDRSGCIVTSVPLTNYGPQDRTASGQPIPSYVGTESMHPHERPDPTTTEADVRRGALRAARWRAAWSRQ